MSYLEKLKAMAHECGLDWDTAKHISRLSTFARLLDASRKQKKEEKTRA